MPSDTSQPAPRKARPQKRLLVEKAAMSLAVVRQLWQTVEQLTSDLQPAQRFSTPDVEKYLRDKLPANTRPITKTKLNYLRDQGILHPEVVGEGELRTGWRYTPVDVRRTLLAQLLKADHGLGVQEIKGWLRIFEDGQLSKAESFIEDRAQPQKTSDPPSPISSAYTRLRNRVIGAVITALGHGKADITPRDSLFGIRVSEQISQVSLPRRVASWEEVRQLLDEGTWHLATSDSYPKLYVYRSLELLLANQPEVAKTLRHQDHIWYMVMLRDTELCYELVVGVPEWESQQPLVQPIIATLEELIDKSAHLVLTEFPGLTTLIRAAIVNQPQIEAGTALSALAEIIATVSDAWDYCAVLVPELSDEGTEKSLYVHEHSSEFPTLLTDKQVDIGRFLSGWCYLNNQTLVVEPTVEGDPRIAAYEFERPKAAAAAPAVVLKKDGKEQVVGVLYVARRETLPENVAVFSDELVAALTEFGHICGDLLWSYWDEVGAIRSIAQLCTRPVKPYHRFDSLHSLLSEVIEIVKDGVSLQDAPHSWVYLLTLNIWAPPQMDPRLMQWMYQRSAHLAGDFLANQLKESLLRSPLSIGLYQVDVNQFVFALLEIIDLPEDSYKRYLVQLTQKLESMQIPRLPTKFYAWGITFRYDTLRSRLKENRTEDTIFELLKITKGALIAGPYINRGHEEMDKGDLDAAITQFRNAKDRARENWYVYKHLAEAMMLNGDYEEAIRNCRIALDLNPQYASANHLLAGCLSYQGIYDEALVYYEKAIRLNRSRPDFFLHYSTALSSMSRKQYEQAIERLKKEVPELAHRSFHEEPYMQALETIEEAQKLSEGRNNSSDQTRQLLARYYFHRGYVYLQAELLKEAIKELSIAKKLAPDDEKVLRVHSHALSRLHRK